MSFTLSDIGVTEPPPPISMPKVEPSEIVKAQNVLRYTGPRTWNHDTDQHVHACVLQANSGEGHYAVRIGYAPATRDWSVWTCTCKQAEQFDAPCKHVLAFFLWLIDKQLHPRGKPVSVPPPGATANAAAASSAVSASAGKAAAAASSAAGPSSARAAPIAAAKPAPPSPARRTTPSTAVPSPQKVHAPPLAVIATRTNLAVPTAISSLSSANSGSHGAPPSSAGQPISPQLGPVSRALTPAHPPPGSTRSTQRGDPWHCAMCSVKNNGGARCRECHAIRHFDAPAPPASMVHSINTWRCSFCAFDNQRSDNPLGCKICQAAAPLPPSTASVASSDRGSAAHAAARGGAPSPAVSSAPPSPSFAPSAASLTMDSVPRFGAAASSAEPATLSFAPSTKKAMSIIAEASAAEVDGSERQDAAPRSVAYVDDPEKLKRWEALLAEPTTADRASRGRSKRATTASPSAAPAAVAPPKPKARVIEFTKPLKDHRKKTAIVLPSESQVAEKQRAQEEEDARLAKELQAAEDEKKEDAAAAESKPKRKAPAKPRKAAAASKSKSKATKRKKRGEEESTDASDAEWNEEGEKVREDHSEEEYSSAAADAVPSRSAAAVAKLEPERDADHDVVMQDVAEAEAAAAAVKHAAADEAVRANGRALPGFLQPKEPKKRGKKAVASAESKDIDAALDAADNDADADAPTKKKRAAPKKPRAKAEPVSKKAAGARAKCGKREADEASREHSEDDADADATSAPPPLVDPSYTGHEYVDLASQGSLQPDDVMMLAERIHAGEGGAAARDRSRAIDERTSKPPGGVSETSLLAALTARDIFLANLAAAPSDELVPTEPPRKKRRVALSAAIGNPTKLYDLLHAPPSQSQEVPLPAAIHEEETDEAQAMADLLANDAAPAAPAAARASPPVRAPSAISSRPGSPAAGVAANTAIALDSEDELEADLDGMLFADAPKAVGAKFKFKEERDAEEAQKQAASPASLEIEPQAEEALEEAYVEEEVDASASQRLAEDIADEDEGKSDDMHKPSEWKKVDRLSSSERKLKASAAAAKAKSAKRKPSAAAPAKRTAKRKAAEVEDKKTPKDSPKKRRVKSEPDHAAAASSPSNHPFSRLQAASSAIIPLFEMPLSQAAVLLEHFDDNTERAVDWLAEHPKEEDRRGLLQGPSQPRAALPASSSEAETPRRRSSQRSQAASQTDELESKYAEPSQIDLEDAVDDLFSTTRTATSKLSPTSASKPNRSRSTRQQAAPAIAEAEDEEANPMDELFPDEKPPVAPAKAAPAPRSTQLDDDGDVLMGDAAAKRATRSSSNAFSAHRSNSTAAFYESEAFDTKMQTPARQRERERRRQMERGKDEKKEERADHEMNAPIAEEEDRKSEEAPEEAPVPLSPIAAAYQFAVSESQSEDLPPAALTGWSKRKPAPAPAPEKPLPDIIRKRQLQTQISQLKGMKASGAARYPPAAVAAAASRRAQPAASPSPDHAGPASSSSSHSRRRRSPAVDINAPRASRAAAAAAAAANSESATALRELREHRARLAQTKREGVKEEEQPVAEAPRDEFDAPSAVQETEAVAASSHAAPRSGAGTAPVFGDDDTAEVHVEPVRRPVGRRSDVVVRSRRRARTGTTQDEETDSE